MAETIKEPPPDADNSDALFSEASAWYHRLRADGVTDAERAAFAVWLARGLGQARAWAELQSLVDELREPARLVHRELAVHRDLAADRPARFGRWPRLRLRNAVVALLLVGVVGWGAARGPTLYENMVADHVTAVGGHRVVALADGSTAELNTDTAITTRFDPAGRRVRLLRGEAWFDVRRDADRPFLVETEMGAVRVVGTQFGVRRQDGRIVVTVGEGLVEVAAADRDGPAWDRAVRVGPGWRVAAGRAGLSPAAAADPATAFAWRHGQLVFSQQPLSSVVGELNRYSTGRIMLLDDRVASHVVSGVFALDRPASVLDALERGVGVRVVRLTPYLTLLL